MRRSTRSSIIPNAPPFIGKQLIQKLVTSDPSPAYVARVSAVFKDNGHGVRGDLAAVTRAILLDPEARGPRKIDPQLRPPARARPVLDGDDPRARRHDRRRHSVRGDGAQRAVSVPRPVRVQLLPVRLHARRRHGVRTGVRHLRLVGVPQSLEPARPAALRRRPSRCCSSTTGRDRTSPTRPARRRRRCRVRRRTPPIANRLVSHIDRLFLHGTMRPRCARPSSNAVDRIPPTESLARARMALRLTLASIDYQVQK